MVRDQNTRPPGLSGSFRLVINSLGVASPADQSHVFQLTNDKYTYELGKSSGDVNMHVVYPTTVCPSQNYVLRIYRNSLRRTACPILPPPEKTDKTQFPQAAYCRRTSIGY